MFGYNNREIVVSHIDWDPGADDYIPLFRAPVDCEVLGAWAINTNAVAADGSNHFQVSLCNGGTAGSSTTVISGTVGGTAGWTALKAEDLTPVDGTLTAGQIVTMHYDENGTGTFGAICVQLEVLYGVGEDA